MTKQSHDTLDVALVSLLCGEKGLCEALGNLTPVLGILFVGCVVHLFAT